MYQVDDIVSDAADHLLSAAARNAVGATDLAGKISLAVGSYLDAATTLRTQSNPMLSKLNAATALCQAAASPAELPVTQLQAIDRYVAPEVTRQKIPGLCDERERDTVDDRRQHPRHDPNGWEQLRDAQGNWRRCREQ